MRPVDDYVDDFDSKITKMNQMLEQDLQYWQEKEALEDEDPDMNQKYADALVDLCVKFKSTMKEAIYPIQVNKPIEFELKDMPFFGRSIGPEEKKRASTFRWPTENIMNNLKLLVPLELKEIRTKGVEKYALTGIQLVFTSGMMTPFFDG